MSLDKLYNDKPINYFKSPRTEIEALLPINFDSILEIGCGTGATMAWLKQKRKITRCVGIDLMRDAIKQAKLVFDHATTANIESEDLPNEKFDLILALDVLEHFSDPWSMIARLHKVLAPGGSILVSLPHVGHWTVSLPLFAHGQWDYTLDGLLDRTHLRFFSERGAIELMTSSGLVLEKIERVRKTPSWIPRLRPRLLRWYVLRGFEAVMPGHLLLYQLLIRVRQAGDHPA